MWRSHFVLGDVHQHKHLFQSPSYYETRPETRPIPVADGWAGAEMRVLALSQLDYPYGPTDGPTDRRTDGRTKLLIESLVRD